MSDAADFQFYPAWREGVRRFLAANHGEGDQIEHSWFYEAFGLEMPEPDTPLKEAERTRLQFLSAFEEMRLHLLTEHQVALASVRGFGYRVVPAGQQTRWAETEGIADVKQSMRKMRDRLTNVNMTHLDAGSRQENADSLARLSMLAGFVRKLDKQKVGALE